MFRFSLEGCQWTSWQQCHIQQNSEQWAIMRTIRTWISNLAVALKKILSSYTLPFRFGRRVHSQSSLFACRVSAWCLGLEVPGMTLTFCLSSSNHQIWSFHPWKNLRIHQGHCPLDALISDISKFPLRLAAVQPNATRSALQSCHAIPWQFGPLSISEIGEHHKNPWQSHMGGMQNPWIEIYPDDFALPNIWIQAKYHPSVSVPPAAPSQC